MRDLSSSVTNVYHDSTEVTALDISTVAQNRQGQLNNGLIFYYSIVIIGSLGIAGNTFVILVISLSSMRKRSTNLLHILQCSIDLLCSIFVLLHTESFDDSIQIGNSLASEFLCRFWLLPVPLWGFMTMSTYNLLAIGFERYLAVVFPIKFNKDLVRKRLFWIILTEFLFGFFPQYAIVFPTSGAKYGFCLYMGYVGSWSMVMALLVLVITVQFFLPLLTLIFLYCHMAIILGKQKFKHVPGMSDLDNNTMVSYVT